MEIRRIPAHAVEKIKHKRTGKEYKDKAEFADVADPNTDTTADFQQDLIITPASIGGKAILNESLEALTTISTFI